MADDDLREIAESAIAPWWHRHHEAEWWDDARQEALLSAHLTADLGLSIGSRVWKARMSVIDWMRVTLGRPVSAKSLGKRATVPLSTTVDDTEDITLADVIADHRMADHRSLAAEFADLDLRERERFIVAALVCGYTQQEVGAMLGVTESRVCQMVRVVRARLARAA